MGVRDRCRRPHRGAVRIKANRLLDRAEDPRKLLDFARTQRPVPCGGAAGRPEEQAQRALADGREDLARAALARRAGMRGQVAPLEEEPLLRTAPAPRAPTARGASWCRHRPRRGRAGQVPDP
ncbi:hypothetical protein GCM10025734_17150 [Kitasatospora paranensis]